MGRKSKTGKRLSPERQRPKAPAPCRFPEHVADRGRAWLAPLVSFVGLLALYVFTLAPSVVGGDSGELTAAALTGGVPHPPGYPVFALLARLFGLLPFGPSPAWRVNLLSAVATSAAAAFLCAAVQRWTGKATAGLVAAALFGTDPVVWHNAVTAEVFGVNAMFAAAALALWVRIEESPRRLEIMALALVSGLAMGNHHTFVFVGAPIILRSLWVARTQLRASGTALVILCGVVGLLPYGYLYFASRSSAAISWGDQSTFDGLLGHVLRREYGTFSMGNADKPSSAFVSSGTFLPTLWLMLVGSLRRLLVVGTVLASVGLLLSWRKRADRIQTRLLLAWLLGYALVFCALSNLAADKPLYQTVLSRFFIQADLLLAMAAGIGWAGLVRRAETRWSSPWLGRLPLTVVVLVFLVGVVINSGSSQRHNTILRDFVTTSFASLPPNAIVVTVGDHLTGAVFYLHEVEKLRPDVIHLDEQLLGVRWFCDHKLRQHPDLSIPAGVYLPQGFTIKQLMAANPNRPLVVLDRLGKWDQSWKDGYKLASMGLIHPVVPKDRYPSFSEWVELDRKAMGGYDFLPAMRYPKGTWEQMLGELGLNMQVARAQVALLYSHENGNAPEPAQMSVALLEQVVRRAGGSPSLGIAREPGLPDLEVHAFIYKNLGIGYEILSRTDPSYLPRVAKAWHLFVDSSPADDADLPAARAYLQTHPPQ
jgi:hypothetical protein